MKIAIVGSGAIGLFYGARLAQAGEEVHFLMRSGLEEARQEGIRIESPEGDVHIQHPLCAASTEEIGPVDWVVIALKATANSVLAKLLPPLLTPNTAILTLQNGLGHEAALAQLFPTHRISGGLCFVCLNRKSAASVLHIESSSLLIGDLDGSPAPATEALAAAWRSTGMAVQVTEYLSEARWRKLIWNIPFNGLSIVEGGVTVDRILAKPESFDRALRLMEEVRLAANAQGCHIEAEVLQQQIERTRGMGAYSPSTLLDFLAHREIELEAIWESPLEAAKRVGVPVPELESLTQQLQAAVQKNRRKQ